MNNDTFLIEEKDLEFAKETCKYVTSENLRNRAAANALAVVIAEKYFQDYDIDTKSSLHKVSQVLEKYDISDIYLKNVYIDVRFYFEEDGIFIPKSHFDNNLLPVAYMLIKLDKELSNSTVMGFVTPESIDKTEVINEYYKVNEESLVSFYDIEPLLIEEDIDYPDDLDLQSYNFIDGNHGNAYSFLKLLVLNSYARRDFIDIAFAQNVFKFVSIGEIEDQVTGDEDILDAVYDDNFALEDVATDEADLSELELAEDYVLSDDGKGAVDLLESQDSLINEFDSEDLLEINSDSENDLLEENNNEDDIDNEDDLITLDEEFSDEPEAILDYPNDAIGLSEELEIEETSIVEDDAAEEIINEELFETNVEYSTSVTPSLSSIENEKVEDTISEDSDVILDEVAIIDVKTEENGESVIEDDNDNLEVNSDKDIEETLDESDVEEDIIEEDQEAENAEQEANIDTLFNPDSDDVVSDDAGEEVDTTEKTVKVKSRLPLLLTVALVASIGYFGFTRGLLPIMENNSSLEPENTLVNVEKPMVQPSKPVKEESEAMPVETVENVKKEIVTNDAVTSTLAAVEKNLDASINISNLTVSWEVPSGYLNNSIAKRYFTKIGKIIQLNLKSELLLMTVQPMSDKITVELEYNNTTNRFKFKKFTTSSGVASIDNMVEQTITKALDVNSNTNMNVFKDIQANPILVIRL